MQTVEFFIRTKHAASQSDLLLHCGQIFALHSESVPTDGMSPTFKSKSPSLGRGPSALQSGAEQLSGGPVSKTTESDDVDAASAAFLNHEANNISCE